MHATLESWKDGWFGLCIGLDRDEIDALIEMLLMIKEDPEQHFHISSDYRAAGGLGDIEVAIRSADEAHNMMLSGRALAPGEALDSPAGERSDKRRE